MIREINYDEVFEGQEHFRVILDCMANPGEIQKLEGKIEVFEGLNVASSYIGLALLDSNVTFYQDHDSQLDQYFILNTSSRPEEPDQADFLFLNGEKATGEMITTAKEGEPEYPEKGAFLVIDIQSISAEPFEGSLEVCLKGPGVKDKRPVYLKGLREETLHEIIEKNEEYPLGVDTILTDPNGNIVCIPRSNQFTF